MGRENKKRVGGWRYKYFEQEGVTDQKYIFFETLYALSKYDLINVPFKLSKSEVMI